MTTPGPDGISVITLDFGNTLVPVDRAGLHRVVERTARAIIGRSGPFDEARFLEVWGEERERQFREEVPRFREVDLQQRVIRVLARLRGMAVPGPGEPWDDTAAAAWSDPDELAFAIDSYSRAFVDAMPPPPSVGPLLRRLATEHRLAVLSNWPLAVTIDRYVEAAGWTPWLEAVVVSQRVGTIKPHPAIFRAAEAAMGLAPAERTRVLHVGDDWAADVVGAKRAGWRAAYLSARPEDSPLPGSDRDATVVADLELAALEVLPAALTTLPPPRPPAGR
ncbi:MAG TPA: HAD family hydrolase [Candidatus Limnocylindrales bacterium]|nr:HAD family hydrolase [Candidatus Limnocylindrales bacterium]